MQNYAIGLSGLNAAQTALDIIGNNVANAATEGYHRQRVDLTASPSSQTGGVLQGGGVDVAGVTRMIDGLLERELVHQESVRGQISQELMTLSSIETMFAEFAEGTGLNETIDAFFEAVRDLAANPLDDVSRNTVVSAAQVLASEFRRLGSSLGSLEDQIVLEAQNTGDSINALITQIAELNGQIQAVEINRGQANNMRDQRDQLIMRLAELTSIETQQREFGVVDVSMGGLPVVTGSIPVEVEVGWQGDQSLCVRVAGSKGATLSLQGGRLGGLLSLINGSLRDVHDDLDSLAQGIVKEVNAAHVQGLGVDGAFTELTGWIMGSGSLAEGTMPVTDGTFYLRLTNTQTGVIERYGIDVDVSSDPPDTLASIAAKIDAIGGVSSSVDSSRLRIVADLGYTFDFMPAVLPEPTVSVLTSASPPGISISGIHSEEENHRYTFTVAGTGSVGNGSLRLDVTDELGSAVCSLNVGVGYAAGEPIEMLSGIKIALGSGELNDGDRFEVEAFATTDTSGFLAAGGMNTFFSGTSASEMRLCRDVAEAPGRIATALGGELTDNVAILRLARVQDKSVDSLNGMTPSEYYQRTVANLGQEIGLKQSRQDNVEAMIQNIEAQRGEISGVNINDEAAQLLVYEQMFQAMAKYMTTLQSAMTTLMQML